jgi:exo-beta-1,3-glucanase (GH17 family)
MLGVWLENETEFPDREIENIKQVLKAIELCEIYSDIVTAVNVGNETQVFWSAHKMEMKNLIKYLRVVRNNIDMPVTTADDYNFWNKPESKSVAEEIDFIAVHMHPLWNGLTVENSAEWMDKIFFEDVKKNHPDKTFILAEVGWATNYDKSKVGPGQQGTLVKGEVGVEAQGRFLIELNGWINQNKVVTFVFEAFDEPWKGGGSESSDDEIEKHWGLFYVNRTPKDSFKYFLDSIANHSKTDIKKQ